ncbi:MAG: hypothetical protein IPO36_17575 [Anaerolineales bacterium]|nr:hypothetical protein [Anaerolineales bacterium]
MDVLSNFLTLGIVFLLTLAFGFWLSRAGKPYNGVLFNIHKLLALAAVIVAVFEIRKTLQGDGATPFYGVLIALTGVSIIALFATGALMSIGKLNYAVSLTIHKAAPILATMTLIAAIYLSYL